MRRRRRKSKPIYWASYPKTDPLGRRWWWLCRNAKYGWCEPEGFYDPHGDILKTHDHTTCGWALNSDLRDRSRVSTYPGLPGR